MRNSTDKSNSTNKLKHPMFEHRVRMISVAIVLLASPLAFAQTPQPQAPFFTPGNLIVSAAG